MGLEGYTPQLMLDEEDFPKLTGRYEAVIERLERVTGESQKTGEPYDFYAMKLKVVATVSGDRGENRVLDATFRNDEAGLKRLADSLFTAGLDADLSDGAIDDTLAKAIGCQVKIRAWVWKAKDSQQVRIVNKFKVDKVEATPQF